MFGRGYGYADITSIDTEKLKQQYNDLVKARETIDIMNRLYGSDWDTAGGHIAEEKLLREIGRRCIAIKG